MEKTGHQLEISVNRELQLLQKENVGYNVGSGLIINQAEGDFDIWKRLIINDNFFQTFSF